MDFRTNPKQNACPRASNAPIIPIIVDHYYVFLADRLKDACLVHLCNEAQASKQTTTIFTRSISETRRVCGLLDAISIGAIYLHCDVSPSERVASLDKLRRKECYVIVTTDVAANLGPIPKVNRIINYSLTWKMTPHTYTQRTGNVVGHIGNSGQVVTLVTQYDLERYLRLKEDVALKEYTVNMDMVMACKGKVEQATREDPSLIEGPTLTS